jgi:hypothetical protein
MLMLGAPMLGLAGVTGFTCWAVAFVVNAGRSEAPTTPVLAVRNLRRDVVMGDAVWLFMVNSPTV